MLFGQIFNRNIYIEKCKINILCIINLQSRGQDPKKSENYWTNLSPIFNKNQDLVPWIGEENVLECCLGIFPTTLIYMFMLENCRDKIVM